MMVDKCLYTGLAVAVAADKRNWVRLSGKMSPEPRRHTSSAGRIGYKTVAQADKWNPETGPVFVVESKIVVVVVVAVTVAAAVHDLVRAVLGEKDRRTRLLCAFVQGGPRPSRAVDHRQIVEDAVHLEESCGEKMRLECFATLVDQVVVEGWHHLLNT